MSALVHFELAGVVGSVLFTEPLHFFTLCAGEACHTNSTAMQDGAQIVLNGQICVPEKTEGGRTRRLKCLVFVITMSIFMKLSQYIIKFKSKEGKKSLFSQENITKISMYLSTADIQTEM